MMSENRLPSTWKIKFLFFSRTLKFLWICENFLKRHFNEIEINVWNFFHFIVFSFWVSNRGVDVFPNAIRKYVLDFRSNKMTNSWSLMD